MLVVSASTDKLFMSTMSNSTVMICLFGIVFGNYAAYSSYSQITSIPIALISILLMNKIARQLGQKASMMTGTYGGIIGSCSSSTRRAMLPSLLCPPSVSSSLRPGAPCSPAGRQPL